MPTEVLSYYLKNKDRKVRLGFQVILQCAPFLKGLKVSGLISMENESYSELEEMFSGMEINFYKLSCSEGKCLVLFYRPKELEEYMNQPKLRELIGQYGYKESNIEEMLAHLSERICECTAQGIGFPHEIGAFLGYPTADVQSFIEKEGRDFIMTGYWKVYSNPEKARMIFHEYDRAKVCAVNEYLDGKNIREIAIESKKVEEFIKLSISVVYWSGTGNTQAMAEGLEEIPPLMVDYKGIQLREFNLDAALERKPKLILVDELAHTNVRGSRNEKRYTGCTGAAYAQGSMYIPR